MTGSSILATLPLSTTLMASADAREGTLTTMAIAKAPANLSKDFFIIYSALRWVRARHTDRSAIQRFRGGSRFPPPPKS